MKNYLEIKEKLEKQGWRVFEKTETLLTFKKKV